MNEEGLKWHIVQLRRSKASSFKAITAFYHDAIYRFLLFRINDASVAEDLLQETFIRLWENRQKLDEKLSLQSWLFTTAGNLSLNHLRHKKIIIRFNNEQSNNSSAGEDPYSRIECKEIKQVIQDAIDSMSDKVRMVFLLCKAEGLSYKAIAERLHISTATVESHMVKALRMIREQLHRYNYQQYDQGKR